MNVENIKRVRDHIAALPPERFNMSWLYSKAGEEAWQTTATPAAQLKDCGTAACIAGWTLAVLKPRTKGLDATDAGVLLGLSAGNTDRLFLPAGHHIRERYSHERAIAVLDHLIATGEVDWSVARASA